GGRDVELDGVNRQVIAANFAHPQDETADPVVTHRPFHFNRRSYEWRQVGRNWELTTAGQVVAQVVPDALHLGMYRVDLGDDPLSDIVSLSKAKAAALSLADRALEKGHLRSQGAP